MDENYETIVKQIRGKFGEILKIMVEIFPEMGVNYAKFWRKLEEKYMEILEGCEENFRKLEFGKILSKM